MRAASPLLLSLGLLLSACQSDPELDAELMTYIEHVNDARVATCDCPTDVGFSSGVECQDALGYVSVDDIGCFDSALAGEGNAGADYLACVSEAERMYKDCLETNVNCEDGVYDQCSQANTDAVATCMQVSAAAREAFAACL